MRSRGFTLIELLIVVAIIAILAAIAVPNFLEAQTRAKVSRTKADMRSIATALEAYRIDTNRYPPDATDRYVFGVLDAGPFLGRLRHLTSPISYMTALPEDIFGREVANGSAGAINSTPYREGGSATGAILRPIVYDYAKFDNGYDSIMTWAQFSSSPTSVQWALSSPGPSTQSVVFLGYSNYEIYDATNGTISEGQILRTSASGEDQPSE